MSCKINLISLANQSFSAQHVATVFFCTLGNATKGSAGRGRVDSI